MVMGRNSHLDLSTKSEMLDADLSMDFSLSAVKRTKTQAPAV